MERYTVSLDGTVKARGLSFKDAIRVGSDLNQRIGHINASKRIAIVSDTPAMPRESWMDDETDDEYEDYLGRHDS